MTSDFIQGETRCMQLFNSQEIKEREKSFGGTSTIERDKN
jgi:hypothetical protein